MNKMTPARRGWAVVLASALALIVGQGSINVFAAGVFLKPVSQELGLGRGSMAAAIGLSNLMAALATPFFGRLIDLYGVRRPLLASILLFALATAGMGLMAGSAVVVMLFYAAAGLCSTGQNPTAYSKVVTRWFDRQRGLALGITLAGVGLGTALVPMAAEALIRAFGWRIGYAGLGLGILLLAFLPVLLLVHEPRPGEGAERAGPGTAQGASFAEAARQWRYWAMVAAFGLAAFAINGTLVHVVPLLTDRGIPPAQAVTAMTGAGLALIAGRLFAGWLMDRLFAPYIGVFFLLCPLVGLLLLSGEVAYPWPLVATVLLGLGIGAEIDLMSFLIGRYFGTRAFGTLHGTMFMFVVLGNAAGASVLGWAFQALGSYTAAFVAMEILLGVAAGLLLVLGPYAYPPPGHGRAAPEGMPASALPR
ncbi:MFS transporter [Roseomonas sp. GC11]|uniref:MFS transporter n=1 Tax=Roseomonas sp. GC11 TaxID=2950546 RepID=UPI00210C873F|nr:MFS transporter [Roseomonas sp. GC11]MCQ4162843.1 MFS transporter [Roseomonas sp. GC11]